MSLYGSSTWVDHPPAPGAVLELLKPITWFPPMWAFSCGLVSSGVPLRGHWLRAIAGVILCGPMLCAASQAVNDWFDREVDAINQPSRPIPSGRMPGRWGLYIAILWSALSLACAAMLGEFVFYAAAIGLVLAWAYSAPPVRLKQNGWWGNLACAASYEGLAWLSGAAIMMAGTTLAAPGSWLRIGSLAFLYSLGAHGIMTLNDFKSMEGDRRSRIASLPVRLGAERAARLACVTMAAPQVLVIALLAAWGREPQAIAVGAILGAQFMLMRRFVQQPHARAAWYSGTGVTLYVAGMMVSAFAVRGGG